MSWVSVKPTRKTEPPTCLPYLGYIHVDDPSFNAAEVIRQIIDRVEKDFPQGTLHLLPELIRAINALRSVGTTHTTAVHSAPGFLMTSLVVMPRGEPNRPAWWDRDPVEHSARSFAQNLDAAFADQNPPPGVTALFGGIEVLIDPGGAKNIGFGVEIQIEATGLDIRKTADNWTWGTTALIYYMRQAAGNR